MYFCSSQLCDVDTGTALEWINRWGWLHGPCRYHNQSSSSSSCTPTLALYPGVQALPFDMVSLSRIRPGLNSATWLQPMRPSMRRSLYLAPPYLLDDYMPRYQRLSSVDASKKRSLAYAHLRECNLCPRLCGVNRYEKTGVCLIGAETVKVGTIAPHFGEEPFIQGHNGSGSVFFSGCNLRCVFCQVGYCHYTINALPASADFVKRTTTSPTPVTGLT